jgi:hypothetical protein
MSDIPPSLEEMQIWFGQHLTHIFRNTGEFNLPVYSNEFIAEIEQRIAPGPRLNAEQRFGIYNQQYWWRLFALLQELFPILVRLFGFRWFNTNIAEPYLLRHPPIHWFLPLLGSHLVQWIQEEYWEEDRELLIQAAEIDAAYERLFHTKENPTPTSESFAKKLYLQPSIALFEWSADFFAFRQQLLEHDIVYWQQHNLPTLDNSKRRYYFILYRTKEGLFHEELHSAQYQLLSEFQTGSFPHDACNRVDPNYKDAIGDWLKTWMERGFFSVINPA